MKLKFSVKVKVAVVFAVMAILLAICIGYAAYKLSYKQVANQYTESAFNAAKMVSEIVNGDNIDVYLINGKNEEYEEIFAQLQTLKRVYNLEYLYVFRPDTQKNDGVYIFDIYTDINDAYLISDLNESVGEDDVYDTVLDIYLTGNNQNNVLITNTEYGHLASSYVPIYSSDGRITAIAGVDISMAVILKDVRNQTIQILATAFGITCLFLFSLLVFLQRQVLNPIVWLSNHMKNFSAEKGELEEFIIVPTGDELQNMSESFNRMVNALKLYMKNLENITADRERIATELNVATQIQASMLPSIFPAFPKCREFDIYASMQPAKEVGGDFYDFFMIDENTLAVVIADVSGKGVPAALFMVIAKTLIKNNAQYGNPLNKVFETVNNKLCENNDAGMFVTAFMGYLNIKNGNFTFVNAGHNVPLYKNGKQFEWLKTKPGFILAGMNDIAYEKGEIVLNKGDELFLYTDGITEAVNKNEELFSDARLLKTVNSLQNMTLNHFTCEVKNAIDKFADGAEQADDITMLILKYIGEKDE